MTYDAIIIGAGHNGLVTACYLAKAGLKTLVLERREIVGVEQSLKSFTLAFAAQSSITPLALSPRKSLLNWAWPSKDCNSSLRSSCVESDNRRALTLYL
jgi:phytoene dehydrogenase-like protein